MTDFALGFVLGAVLGAAVAVVVAVLRGRLATRALRETFASIAAEALDANSRRLGESAAALLDGRKALIDQTLQTMQQRLEQVRSFLQQVETTRKEDFGQLSSSVSSLATTTGELHRMLASTQRRGAWGERMAQDVLRLAGLQEGINYVQQSAADAESGRPDFTFFLPNELKVNMDVKFPLERYKAYLDAADAAARAEQLAQLVTAVRGHIAAVSKRGYIDPAVPTVNYVIVFIPSEQIFSLVLEAQADLIDEALGKHVVLASPLTLYAMLSVIRQAAENANILKTADEVTKLLGQFYQQWQKYNEELDKLGQRIEQTADQYRIVRAIRSSSLQKPLDKIEELRTA
ncbi:MAG: DNA recombination protein RmuC, partial [Phycisphaerae bacterium]|nr:DNA recombination protein RmuC [Phycisphaerae bacterium]